MKRVLLLLTVVLTGKVGLAGDPVYFADPNLKAAVEEELGIADPNATDMLALTSLDAGYRNITDLTGLECATSLTYLKLHVNQINEITQLAGLSELEVLTLYGNSISDISSLSGLINLQHLSLYYNLIEDISALSALDNLTKLALSHNQILDCSALAGLTNLTELNLRYNQISDISSLSGLTNLTWLDLHANKIEDISALSNLTKLTWLSLYGNDVSDISSLAALTDLTFLDLGDNQTQMSNIPVLAGLTKLTVLYLHHNKIYDISPLAGLTNLTELHLYRTEINDISPLAGLTELRKLTVPENDISDISVLSGLTNLTLLNLSRTQIYDISALSSLTQLTQLYLQDNSLNDEAYCVYIPLIQANNPVAEIVYDPAPPTLDCNSVSVVLDIKPQSCPNPLNLKARGILPVAILGTDDFDVNSIDPASLELAGVSAIRSSYEDVATVVADGNECECTEQGPDGYIDLNLKFKTQEIVGELVDETGDLIEGQVLSLTITGRLLDDTLIEGTDCIVLVGNVSKWLSARDSDINKDGKVDLGDFAELAAYWLESEATVGIGGLPGP